ncbi:hypothetical protein BGX31_002542 [Mortierella sp. GBA43]|nr:hypothetical protein BGX31_002542 [Mortierella sp. GBA43]
MFNPVRLDMQENRQHPHPYSSGSGGGVNGSGNGNRSGNNIGRTSGLIHALSGRNSAEPLNNNTTSPTTPTTTMMGASGISGVVTQDMQYPYHPYDMPSHQQYVSTVPGGDDQNVRYMPPTDPGYAHYAGYNQHHPEYHQQGGDETLYHAQYHPQPYYQPEDGGVHSSAAYYDPGTSGMYYHDQRYPEEDDAMQQQYLQALQQDAAVTSSTSASPVPAPPSPHHAPSVTNTSGGANLSAVDVSSSAQETTPGVTTTVPGIIPGSVRASLEAQDDDAYHQTKSETWPENSNRFSTLTAATGSTSALSHSPKRNPQLVSDSTDTIKVPITDDNADTGHSGS